MDLPIFYYLSMRYESEEERKYIVGLSEQYETASAVGSFHLALFAYHLLFMTFVYQTIFKIKKWMPKRFSDALIQSPADKRKMHWESLSVWNFSDFPESSIFEMLNLLCVCEKEVSRCKKIIKYRNNGFGHATGILVSSEEFEKKIEEYDKVALEIHRLTHGELLKIFDEYFKSMDSEIEQTKDEIELSLITPNRLSDKDLETLAAECLIDPNDKKEKVSEVLKNDFNIFVEIENNMEDKKQKCEVFFNDYLKLDDKISSRTGNPRDGIVPTTVSEMNELLDLREKVKGCLVQLSDDQLIALYGQPEL